MDSRVASGFPRLCLRPISKLGSQHYFATLGPESDPA